MNMPPTDQPGEPPIPFLPPPSTGEGDSAPDSICHVQAALLRLLCLALYVAVMQALGYRFRRRRAPRPSGAAPARSQGQAAPATPPSARADQATPAPPTAPRRTIDSGICVALLAEINIQVAATRQTPPIAAPIPAAPIPDAGPDEPPQPATAASSPGRHPPAPATPGSAPRQHPATPSPRRTLVPCLHDPPPPPVSKNPRSRPARSHALFVPVPQRSPRPGCSRPPALRQHRRERLHAHHIVRRRPGNPARQETCARGDAAKAPHPPPDRLCLAA